MSFGETLIPLLINELQLEGLPVWANRLRPSIFRPRREVRRCRLSADLPVEEKWKKMKMFGVTKTLVI